jgi:hypothetical protein
VSALTESDTGIRLILDAEELVEYLLTEAPDYDLDDLQMMLIRVGRNYGPYVVNELYCNGDLHPRQAQVVVPDVWSMVEHPLHALDRDEWRQLFNLAGYTHNGKRRAKPRKPRLLYRGADEEHRDGWSWTDDRDKAQWFADRIIHAEPGQVWQATVEPARLLARITDGREESEYVVDTSGLAISPA